MARTGRTVDDCWPPPEGRRRSDWEALSAEIAACHRCPLARTRTHVVVHRGSLRPTVLFVGEAPGAEEDRTGVPFVGRAGRRLDEAIARLGLGAGEYAVVNTVKCRPPSNRFDRRAADACRPFLARQVAFLDPRVIVPLGAPALAAFRPDLLPVTRAAGRPSRWRDRSLFPLLHPAAGLHSGRFRERWTRDVGSLGRWLASGRRPTVYG